MIGHAAADDRAEAVVGRREHAAHQEIADLGRGEIDRRPASMPESTSFSIERPPTPVAWKTRHSKSFAQVGRDLLHGRRRHAEHGEADRRQSAGALRSDLALIVQTRLHHAGDGVGAVGEHRARDRIEALHVGDRIHHRDVGRADIGADVARRDRRDHQLRHADGQGAHGRRDQRGAAGAAGRNDAARHCPGGAASWRRRPPSPSPTRRGRTPNTRRSAAAVVQRDFLRRRRRRWRACRWSRRRPAASASRCPAIMSRMKRSSSPLVSSVPATSTTGGPDAPCAARRLALLPGGVFDPRHAASTACAPRPRCARSAPAATSASAASGLEM